MTNSEGPDQTAEGAVWSGHALFAQVDMTKIEKSFKFLEHLQ